MDKLLLFTGLPENTEQIQLHGFIEKCFSHEQLKDLWMDPRQEARAVALFENVIDYERIQSKMKRRQFTLEDNQIFLEKANPTNSVFVHTCGAFTSAAVDKLRMLFSSKKYNCGQVKQVVDMTGGVFEIIFENGWDSVFLACQSEWIAEKKKIDVWPFFDCFKEPADEQCKRLQKGLQLVSLKTIQSELASDSSTTNVTKQDSKENNYTKRFDLKNKLVAFLLLNLEFESAVRDLKVEIEILESSDSWLFTFRGQRDKVKQLYKLMASLENPENQLSPCALAFFCRKRVEAQLKHEFQNSGFRIAFVDEENLVIAIKNKKGKELPFNKFMKSLLKTQLVVKLTSKDYQLGKEWEAFEKSFNRTYRYCQVYIHDNSVYLMYLSICRSELNSLIVVIKKGLALENLEERDVEKEIKTICSSYLIWLFKVLHFDKAVKKYFQGMIYFNEKENQMMIKSTREGTEKIQAIITASSIKVSEEEKEFLKDEAVRMSLKSLFEKDECHFEFNIGEKTDIFIKNKRGERIIFSEFLLRILVKIDCSLFLEESQKSNGEWSQLIESIVKAESPNPPVHVIMEDSKVKLLTVPGNEDMVTSTVEKIKEIIHDKEFNLKNNGSNTVKDSSKEKTINKVPYNVPSDEKFKIDTKSLQIDEKKYEYSKLFLIDEFDKIRKSFKCSSMRLFGGAIHIEGSGQNVNTAFLEIKSLIETINIQDKFFSFPGLLSFIASPEGSSIIDNFSKKFKCIIEFSDMTSKSSPRLEAVQKETVRIDYRVLLLQTARFEGFNIHLTQGKMGDMELNMTVEFSPSKEDKRSIIKNGRTSLHLEITLPEWKSCHGKTNKEHFAHLRSSLREAVKLVLEQAKQTNCGKIGFSTEKIHDAEFSFPLDCIAEVLVSELVSLFELAGCSHSEESSLNSVDVYIIESECNAVFKAFDYFINKHNGKLEGPDQERWDNACPQDLNRYNNYHTYDTRIEVRTLNISSADEKTLFCYPVDQSLEVETCPACEEHPSIRKILSESLKRITDELPDGLCTGQVHRVNSFPHKKDVIVYCTSPWGFDCDKMIQTLLKKCILDFNGFDAVHIVLPGVHGTSRFPKQYLAQAVFKVLDSLLQAKKEIGLKRIALVVNSEYKECFESEWNRRYPKKEEPKSFFRRIINTFKVTWEFNDTASIWKSTASDTLVNFTSLSSETNHTAATELEKELRCLLNKNSETLYLDKQQTTDFENCMERTQEILVSVVLEKILDSGEHLQSYTSYLPKRASNAEDRKHYSTLRIEGLSELVVKEFKIKIKPSHGLKFDTTPKKTSKLDLKQFSNKNSESSAVTDVLRSSNSKSSATKNLATEMSSDTSIQNLNPQNEMTCSYSTMYVPSFSWKFETKIKFKISFCDFGPMLSTTLEKAYIQEKAKIIKKDVTPFTEINFTDMTATLNGLKIAIIRHEVMPSSHKEVKLPTSWKTHLNNTFWMKIGCLTDEFKNIQRTLDECFFQSVYDIFINEIICIQNEDLFKRFELKKVQLGNSVTSHVWHKVSDRTSELVCKHGFHPTFSSMPDGTYLGDGVLFYFDAKKCVTDSEVMYCKKVYLIYSEVALGRTHYGQHGLRSPPFKTSSGLEFDSVRTMEECMIFSDSQAYPTYLVSLRCYKRPKAVYSTTV